MKELEQEIKALQDEMSLAIDNGDLTRAHELENEIDELQKQIIRIKSCEQ